MGLAGSQQVPAVILPRSNNCPNQKVNNITKENQLHVQADWLTLTETHVGQIHNPEFSQTFTQEQPRQCMEHAPEIFTSFLDWRQQNHADLLAPILVFHMPLKMPKAKPDLILRAAHRSPGCADRIRLENLRCPARSRRTPGPAKPGLAFSGFQFLKLPLWELQKRRMEDIRNKNYPPCHYGRQHLQSRYPTGAMAEWKEGECQQTLAGRTDLASAVCVAVRSISRSGGEKKTPITWKSQRRCLKSPGAYGERFPYTSQLAFKVSVGRPKSIRTHTNSHPQILFQGVSCPTRLGKTGS